MSPEPEIQRQPMIAISIIITTCNRAEHLRQTLEAIGQLLVPPDYQVELIVVDNASTDETPAVVSTAILKNLEVSRFTKRCLEKQSPAILQWR